MKTQDAIVSAPCSAPDAGTTSARVSQLKGKGESEDPGFQLSERAALAIISALVFLLLLPHLGYVPAWDAGLYYDCLVNAASNPFSLPALSCSHHSSHAYIFTLAILQYGTDGSVLRVHLANIALFISSILAFHSILRVARPLPEDRPERILLTAHYALLPVSVANILFTNLDLPVMAGMVWAVAALLRGQFLLTALSGLWMAFSKESGAPLYVAVLLVAAAVFPRRSLANWRKLPILAAPLLVYAAHLANPAASVSDRKLRWVNERVAESSLKILFDLNPFSRSMRAYLFDIFVLNFNWLYSLSLLTALLWLAFKGRRQPEAPEAALRRMRLGLFLLFMSTLYVLTRVRPFNNVRYLLPIFPWLIALSWESLRVWSSRRRLREALLAVTIVPLLASNIRTCDPISLFVGRTGEVGGRRHLRLENMLREVDHEENSLVYNLEYLDIEHLHDEILSLIRPGPKTLVTGSIGHPYPGWVDPKRWRRTGRRSKQDGYPIAYIVSDRSPRVPLLGESVYFVDFSNGARSSFARNLISRYPSISGIRLERGAHAVNLFLLSKSGPRPSSPGIRHLLLPLEPIRGKALGELIISAARQEWGRLELNRSVEGRRLSIGGTVYGTGIGTHSFSAIELTFEPRYSILEGACGVDDETGARGSIRCKITSDEEILFEAEPVSGGAPPKRFRVDVTGRSRLFLEVDDAGDGMVYDHADWVGLTLH